jgi:hypothetical protein
VRSVTYPEWGVGSITDISFTGDGDEIQRWARVEFNGRKLTLPLDNLTFVDFAKRERDVERAQRFLVAANDAISQQNHELATRRLVYARNADPRNPEILSLLAGEYRELGRLLEAGRTVRDWIRADPDNPAAYKLAERIYEDMGAPDLAADAAAAGRKALLASRMNAIFSLPMLMFMVGTSHFFLPGNFKFNPSGSDRAVYWIITIVLWGILELKALGVGGTKPGGANAIFDTHRAALWTGFILVAVWYVIFYLVLKA